MKWWELKERRSSPRVRALNASVGMMLTAVRGDGIQTSAGSRYIRKLERGNDLVVDKFPLSALTAKHDSG